MIQVHSSGKTASLCIRTPEGLGHVRSPTYVRLRYPDTQSHKNLTVQYILAKRSSIRHDIWSFNRNCFRYAERCKIVNQRLLEREQLTKAAVGIRMKTKLKGYKNDYSKKGLRESQIIVGDETYIDHPQHLAFASYSSEEFAWKDYNKLIRRIHEPQKVV